MAEAKTNTRGVHKTSKNEICWVSAYDKERKLKYVITSNKDRSMHYIYDANYKKLGSNPNPNVLEEKYFNKD